MSRLMGGVAPAPQTLTLPGRPSNALIGARPTVGNALTGSGSSPPPPPAPVPPAAPRPAPPPPTAMVAAGQQLGAMAIPPAAAAQKLQMVAQIIELIAPLAQSRTAVPFDRASAAADDAVSRGLFPPDQAASFLRNFDPKSQDLRPALRAALQQAVLLGAHLALVGQQSAPNLALPVPAASPMPTPPTAPLPIPSHHNGWATTPARGSA